MFKRISSQGFLFYNLLLFMFILTIQTRIVKCDTNSTSKEPEENTGVSPKENVHISSTTESVLTTNSVVKSEGKDIYIVFNDTVASTDHPSGLKSDISSGIDALKVKVENELKSALVQTQDAKLSATPLVKEGHIGGHGHKGHHNKIKKPKIKKKHKKKKGLMKGFMKMMSHPIMLIPQFIMLGFSPVFLANLKMMVMNALMINNMALSTAVFMVVRNMVFGPAPGPKIRYHNVGYQKPSQVHKHYIPPPEPQHAPVYHEAQEPPHPPVIHAPDKHIEVHHPKVHHAPPVQYAPPMRQQLYHAKSPSHTQHTSPYLNQGEVMNTAPELNIHALTQQTYNKPSGSGESHSFLPHDVDFTSQDDSSSYNGYEYKGHGRYGSSEVEISPTAEDDSSLKGYDYKGHSRYGFSEGEISPSMSSSYYSSAPEDDHHALVDGNYFNKDIQRHDESEDFDDNKDTGSFFYDGKSNPTASTTVDSFKKYSSLKAHASYRLSSR